jgi:Skp family chaperone for outer membrane proteins
MKHMMKQGLCVLLIAATSAAASTVRAARQAVSIADYGVILERMPFGRAPQTPPPTAVVNPAPTKAELDIFRNMRVCFMDNALDGLRVVIVDNKENKTYDLGVGESDDGLTLLSADYDREMAFVQKNGFSQWIDSKGLSSETALSAGTGGTITKVATSTRASRLPANVGQTRSATVAAQIKRREEVLQQRRDAIAAREAVEDKDALRQRLSEYNMDLIRAGGSLGLPLPIPLTKEQDDQLVAEGVLPPAE